MSVAICTLFRDSADIIDKCFRDRDLWEYPKAQTFHICVEGDSTDNTYDLLQKYEKTRPAIVEKIDFGKPRYPSIVHPDRFQVLARSWNRGLELALSVSPEYIFILDSDISTPPNLIPKLISAHKDVVAPMMLVEGTDRFRDTWAYWADQNNFVERYPYHKRYKKELFEVEGVGLPFMRAEVIRTGARFTEADEVRGLCQEIKARGYKIFVDGTLFTWHPAPPALDAPKPKADADPAIS